MNCSERSIRNGLESTDQKGLQNVFRKIYLEDVSERKNQKDVDAMFRKKGSICKIRKVT